MQATELIPAPQHAVQPITPMEMLATAVAQGADIDKLSKLMDLQERWEANNARKAFVAAMNAFKQNPPDIFKNKHVKAGSAEYDHATLDHICDGVGAALGKQGLSHRWDIDQKEKIRVTCIITHAQGHSESVTLESMPDTSGAKNSIQAIGSAVTYLQRYTLLAAVGMAAKGQDNDGQSAGGLFTIDARYVADRIDLIENAQSAQDLVRVYNEGYKVASEAKDKKAMTAFIAAKDKRKKELCV